MPFSYSGTRAQVSARMPPAGQEAAYFSANVSALSEEMLLEGDELLVAVEASLKRIMEDPPGL